MLYSKDRNVPVKHRKSIDTSLSCPRCEASYELLYLKDITRRIRGFKSETNCRF